MYKDEDFTDPRRMAAGRDAMALDHQLRGHANQHLTDGLVSTDMLPVLGALAFIDTKAGRGKALDRLVAAGYAHTAGSTCTSKQCPASVAAVPDGFVMVHDWWKNQERRERVEERREKQNRKKDLLGDAFLVAQLIARDGYHCRYCGCPVRKTGLKDTRSKNKLTIDHVDPDGTNDVENLVIACLRCNGRKNRRTPDAAGMTLRPAPRIARLGAIEGDHDESWVDHDQRQDQTTDQTTDQIATSENAGPTTPETGDLSRAGASPARDARDSGPTTVRSGQGTGPGLVAGLVGGPVGTPLVAPEHGPTPEQHPPPEHRAHCTTPDRTEPATHVS